MKFTITRTSDLFDNNEYETEFNTLEDLIAFIDKIEESVIISRNGLKTNLEIYDDWRE